MKPETRHNLALISRGFFLATAIYASLYAWWMYQDVPTGLAHAMYQWIWHFYVSTAIAFLAVIAFVLTFSKRL